MFGSLGDAQALFRLLREGAPKPRPYLRWSLRLVRFVPDAGMVATVLPRLIVTLLII